MNLKVPVVGTNVVAEGEGVSPAITGATPPPVQPTPQPAQPPQRQSLHNVRMTPQPAQVEVRGEFDKFGRVKWVPVEQAQEQAQAEDVADVDASTNDAGGVALDGGADVPPLPTQTHATAGESIQVNELQRQIADLKETVSLMARVQMHGMQPQPTKPAAPTPPDPSLVDWYDAAQVAEYHRTHDAYIDAKVQYQVNEAIAPHSGDLQDARLIAQHDRLVGTYGDDPAFKAKMAAAVKLVASSNFKFSLPEAYEYAASIVQPATSQQQQQQSAATTSQPVAKPAQRTMTREEATQKAEQAKRLPASQGVSGTPEPGLPSTLRNVNSLGRIMFHNQQSGRARPIGN